MQETHCKHIEYVKGECTLFAPIRIYLIADLEHDLCHPCMDFIQKNLILYV